MSAGVDIFRLGTFTGVCGGHEAEYLDSKLEPCVLASAAGGMRAWGSAGVDDGAYLTGDMGGPQGGLGVSVADYGWKVSARASLTTSSPYAEDAEPALSTICGHEARLASKTVHAAVPSSSYIVCTAWRCGA